MSIVNPVATSNSILYFSQKSFIVLFKSLQNSSSYQKELEINELSNLKRKEGSLTFSKEKRQTGAPALPRRRKEEY